MFDQGPHVVLRRDGVCLVLKTPEGEMPQVEYWGGDFGITSDESALNQLDAMTLKVTPPQEKPDAALRPSLLPQGAEAFAGRPGLDAYRGGKPVFVRWASVTVSPIAAGGETEANTLNIVAEDAVNAVKLELKLSIKKGGLVLVEQTVTNIDATDNPDAAALTVNWLESTLPMPPRADTLTQFTGRWPLEKQPRTAVMPSGSVTRECRHGKTSHESPWMFIASDGEPKWSEGEVWACHLAWSGNQTYRIDNMPPHEPLIGAGELLGPGEIQLAAGESYTAPQVCFSYSANGLDGMASRFHTWLRSLPKHVSSPRPFTLNTWEAVYESTLKKLADRAAAVGVERFVLDDGWFHERRDDTKGLGDWVVDPEVWPNGLDGIAQHVHDLGMQFGLWFEPEMVNLDSDCAREHPDWILAAPEAVPYREDVSYRTQYVLDLANPDAYRHVHDQMAALVEQLGIDYIKWDHNRDVTEPVHDGRYGLHEQTLACYRLFDDLKKEFLKLEIESCSSGGGRVDLGILEYADRIWVSDCVDPVERADIQRYTSLLVPPAMMGEHVGASPAHSTRRETSQELRMAMAFFGHMGIEWNLLKEPDDALAKLAVWVAEFKKHRDWFAIDTCVHADSSDPAVRLDGMVMPNRNAAIYRFTQLTTSQTYPAAPVHLPGLDPKRKYRISPLDPSLDLEGLTNGQSTLGWWNEEGVVLTGEALQRYGIRPPSLHPQQAVLFKAVALS